MSSQDILATIDDAVSSRCACGCGTQLDPAGESMWFAGPDCQIRFHERNTTNPHEVQNRVDAAEAYDGGDHLRIPLSEPGVEPRTRRAARTHWLTERLRRLSSGPLRSPMHERLRPEDYWPLEAGRDEGSLSRFEWSAVEPRDLSDSEDWSNYISGWMAEHLPERPLTDFQRLVLNGTVASVPEPPSPAEVMDNMRRYRRLISDQPTFVGNEETVQRVNLLGHDMDIVTSPLVPDNTIIAIDNAALNRARDEALANMSIGFAVEPSTRYRVTAQYAPPGMGEHVHVAFGALGTAVRRFLDEIDPRPPWKRAAGWHRPRNNPRMRKLHTDYSRRRRRNR